MAIYLFVSKHEVRGTQRNPECRMVLRPIANQTTYRRSGRVEDLGNRRLQMDINDRTEVCNWGNRNVYALWQPNMTPCSNDTRRGRLSIHTRNGEEMFVYDRYEPANHPHFQPRTTSFALIRVGTYTGRFENNAPLLANNVVLNDNMLEDAFRNRFGNNGEDTERLLRSLKDELVAYLLLRNQSQGETATDNHTTADERAEATPTMDSDAERNRAITALQTQRLDYSKIVVGQNRRVVFNLLDKLALGIAEFDYYKADGSIRHAKGTRNPYTINEQLGTDNRSGTEDGTSLEELNSNPEDRIERIRYFDIERGGFRTFNVGRVIGLSLAA